MIFLSLGSNLPSPDGSSDRFENIISTIKIISSNNYTLVKKSSYYETPSYPNKKNPKFINVIIRRNNFNRSINILKSIKVTIRGWQIRT